MPTRHAQQSQLAAVSTALFRTWLAGAKPGQRLEYHRGALALDRSKATSSLKRAERRKLATVADHVLALAEKGKLHLIQERHGDGDYSYWAVVRAPARSIQLIANRFSTTDAPDNAPVISDRYVPARGLWKASNGRESEMLEALGARG